MTSSSRGPVFPARPGFLAGSGFLAALILLCSSWCAAQQRSVQPVSPALDAALPSAPEPQQPPDAVASSTRQGTLAGASALPPARKYNPVIEPGQTAPRLSAGDKLIYVTRENVRILNLFPAMYSAGYEQLTGSDPKYGNDAGAGAMKFGASLLGSTITRTLSDGVFAAAFHQDPRYHRVAYGSIWTRGLRSASRALLRHSDDGPDEVNVSGLMGRAAAAALTLAYYPPRSQNARVVLSTFGTSIVLDAGGDLVLEFFPDVARKYPFLKRFQMQ